MKFSTPTLFCINCGKCEYCFKSSCYYCGVNIHNIAYSTIPLKYMTNNSSLNSGIAIIGDHKSIVEIIGAVRDAQNYDSEVEDKSISTGSIPITKHLSYEQAINCVFEDIILFFQKVKISKYAGLWDYLTEQYSDLYLIVKYIYKWHKDEHIIGRKTIAIPKT